MKKVFDPEWGNPSLRNIVEAEFPEPVSLMPSTPGWWVLLLVVIAFFARAFWRRRQRYLRDRYRRDALAQLSGIKQRLAGGTQEAVRELAPLIRATAIAARGRDMVSGLEGDAYAAALAEFSPGQDRLPVADLQRLAYAPLDEVGGMDMEGMISELERWIRQHKGDDD
ncbi:DUF4381 domain-containing protein [Haloferula sp.]|uniref:DUF4381 domain-containing protein n=1 Tax=Haloferula sp. TaxID=2497595 RepID=UPI00329F9265